MSSSDEKDTQEEKISSALALKNQRKEEIEKFCESDPLVQSIRKDYASVDVLKETLIRLAEISAVISYERKEAVANGESGSLIARREITALTALRDATLKMIDQRLKQQEIDLDSVAFINLLKFVVNTFQEAMSKAGVPVNEQRSVMANLSKMVDAEDWKLNARKVMGTM